VVILIDYPGINFRLFKVLKQYHFKIFYYISPQLWAWKKGRVKEVKEYVDRMFVIFPFEKEFYAKHGVEVDFVGHPLLDELPSTVNRQLATDNTIALIPGSRKQEISYLLPEYLKVVDEFPQNKFVVTGISTIGEEFYRNIIGRSKAELQMDNTYRVLSYSSAAIVTSGTATLETALHHVPEVICYKGSWISYYIINALIDKSIGFICIVNLICGKRVVEELIQSDVNKQRLVSELKKLLSPEGRNEILSGYQLLQTKLGEKGASKRAAGLMIKRVKGV
jgi:lipid-A-disaccharide synthase